MGKGLILQVPGGETNVLLHACCAPCSGAIIEIMLQQGIRPTVFYSNANIFPLEEYEIRRNECRRYCEANGLDFIDDDYDHKDWQRIAKGLEHEPERGARCLECFRYRLRRAAAYAHSHGFHVLTTTLASSRWKDLNQVNLAGEEACAPYEDVLWWPQNWRKGGLQERRGEIIKEMDFYNQLYPFLFHREHPTHFLAYIFL
ncbi:MAG: epoxyqueuosine reductase QueH [Bacteroidales bacterium]|nr:epoxyqueuosine reductase QueH [Bacteroidales bacterium]